MDPVSALSVAGVAFQLAGLCVSVPQALSNLRDNYDEAGRTIRNIKSFCSIIELAAGKIQDWLLWSLHSWTTPKSCRSSRTMSIRL